MTIAICLNCGERRVGAITPCANCGVETSGLFGLDLMFSDRTMSIGTLDGFSGVIRAIRLEATDDGLSREAFLLHISDRYPELLAFDPPATVRDRAREVLARVDLPEVELELRADRPTALPGVPSLTSGGALVALGVLIALIGSRIETYELAWYQDVRVILLVGLGSVAVVGGFQRFAVALRRRWGARESV